MSVKDAVTHTGNATAWHALPADDVAQRLATSVDWFAPLDLLLVHRRSQNLEFAFGGATKIGDPSGATYDYIVNGRVTWFF